MAYVLVRTASRATRATSSARCMSAEEPSISSIITIAITIAIAIIIIIITMMMMMVIILIIIIIISINMICITAITIAIPITIPITGITSIPSIPSITSIPNIPSITSIPRIIHTPLSMLNRAARVHPGAGVRQVQKPRGPPA